MHDPVNKPIGMGLRDGNEHADHAASYDDLQQLANAPGPHKSQSAIACDVSRPSHVHYLQLIPDLSYCFSSLITCRDGYCKFTKNISHNEH